MFIIDIELAYRPELTGLRALDECRRLKLPDSNLLCCSGSISRDVTVGEGFARLHFTPDARAVRSLVTLNVLTPDDISTDTSGIRWSKDITDERIVELFVAGSKTPR